MADAFDDLAFFYEIHSHIRRQGPGNQASTLKALQLAGTLPSKPVVLDIGCGPGAQTAHLAQALDGARIGAVDNHQPYVDAANQLLKETGVADRAQAQLGDMTQLDFPDGYFDLLWCEGAAYIMGVHRALAHWRRLLKPRGVLAFSEAVWLTETPPGEARQFWQDYPAMMDMQGNRRLIEAEGYELLGDFVLPPEAWWDDYYQPLEDRIKALALQHKDQMQALQMLAATRAEIDLYRRYGDSYGYGFFILAKPSEQ